MRCKDNCKSQVLDTTSHSTKQLKRLKHAQNLVINPGLNKTFQNILNHNKFNSNINDISNLNKDRKYGETYVNKKSKHLKSATKQ